MGTLEKKTSEKIIGFSVHNPDPINNATGVHFNELKTLLGEKYPVIKDSLSQYRGTIGSKATVIYYFHEGQKEVRIETEEKFLRKYSSATSLLYKSPEDFKKPEHELLSFERIIFEVPLFGELLQKSPQECVYVVKDKHTLTLEEYKDDEELSRYFSIPIELINYLKWEEAKKQPET